MKIKFFTIDCPRCNVLQKKMDRKGVNYEVIKSEKIFKEKNITVFPMLSIDDGPLMNFTEANAWVNELEEQNGEC